MKREYQGIRDPLRGKLYCEIQNCWRKAVFEQKGITVEKLRELKPPLYVCRECYRKEIQNHE